MGKSRGAVKPGGCGKSWTLPVLCFPKLVPLLFPQFTRARLRRSVSSQAASQQILDHETRNRSPHHNHSDVKKTMDHFRVS